MATEHLATCRRINKYLLLGPKQKVKVFPEIETGRKMFLEATDVILHINGDGTSGEINTARTNAAGNKEC